MAYLIIAVIFFAVGFRTNNLISTVRMARDKNYIEKIVNKMFEVGSK